MADVKNTSGAEGNTAVPQHGDHDRVVMLSLLADGTPDQHNPEIIGGKEFALEAAREQFRQQAVSAVDVRERGVTAGTGGETVEQDPAIAALQEKHQAAEKHAESAAESTVNALFTSDEGLRSAPAGGPARSAEPEKPVVDKPAPVAGDRPAKK